MSEISGISKVNQMTDYDVKQGKAGRAGNVSFSSYMEEEKSLDDIFEQASVKYQVPVELLKAIGKAESDFNPNAVSRCGAQGVMQLMPATAASLGVTDAFDPEQNIMGGSKYIADLLKKYDGDTRLALAAYNAGMGNVKKYGGIPPFEETQNYVVKVMKYMKQDMEAGSVTVSGSKNSVSSVKAPLQAAGLHPVPEWYISPSNHYGKIRAEDAAGILSEIFSYQDYLKFLDLFFKEQENEERKG